MPPASGGILSDANAAINFLVVCLSNLLAIAAAREEHHEICEACELCSREKDLRAQAIFTNLIHFHTHSPLGAIHNSAANIQHGVSRKRCSNSLK